MSTSEAGCPVPREAEEAFPTLGPPWQLLGTTRLLAGLAPRDSQPLEEGRAMPGGSPGAKELCPVSHKANGPPPAESGNIACQMP